MLQFVKNGQFQIFWILESGIWKFQQNKNSNIPGNENSGLKIKLSDQNWVEEISNMLQFVKIGYFRIFWNLEIPGKWKFKNSEWKIKLSDQNWVEKIPNMLQFVKMVISGFSGIWNLEIPEKWEFKNFEWKIKLSDQNWVEKIANMLQFVKKGHFQIFWNLESGNSRKMIIQ